MNQRRMNRRQFIASLLAMTPFATRAAETLDADGLTARILGYHSDHQTVDPRRWPKKAKDENQIQRCRRCAFYTKIDKDRGSCSIFDGQQVPAEGWCNAWTRR